MEHSKCLTISLTGINYLKARVYIGIWLGAIALVVASMEGSVFVKVFTRFTEELFSALISLLYILESATKLWLIFGRHPLLPSYCDGNATLPDAGGDFNDTILANMSTTERSPVLESLPTHDQHGRVNQPNTALFCLILSLGTFAIAYFLLVFRNSQFLGRSVSSC